MPKDYEKADRDIVRYGYKASTVPGTVSGLIEAHKNFGKLSLSEILIPVIRQASEGIIVSYDLEQAIQSSPQLYTDPESRRIYFKNDKPVSEGSLMKRPDLAKSLEAIAINGEQAFYQGEIAEKFILAMESNKGFVTSDDLKNYKSRFTSPIAVSYTHLTLPTICSV